MMVLHTRRSALALIAASASLPVMTTTAQANGDGIVKVRSAYAFDETVSRLKTDIAGKGIQFYLEVDQAALAKANGIDLNPSTLLIFGNPPLGTQFITARAEAGLDWPVRLLVFQDALGDVWAAYTDFQWIARRHRITDRNEQFQTASQVIASITSSVIGA